MTRSLPTLHHSRDQPLTDNDLLARVRAGDTQAFADIYDRHRGPALRMAIAVSGPSRGEDLVAEVFTRTLQLLLSGSGPDRAFRAYLFTAIRNLNVNVILKERRALPIGDLEPLDQLPCGGAPTHSPAHDLAAEALEALPVRWRQVLWLTTIEGRSLEEVALLLDSNPNAIAQLAFRAREALRKAYLAQLASIPTDVFAPRDGAARLRGWASSAA